MSLIKAVNEIKYDDISKVEAKLQRLIQIRDDLAIRQANLSTAITLKPVEAEIARCYRIAEKMKQPTTVVKRKFTRRCTPKYPTELEAMKAVADVIVASGDLSSIRSDIRQWIIEFYSTGKSTNIETCVNELDKEIDLTIRKLDRERCCM